MGETSEEIAAHIEEQRGELVENVKELERKVKRAVDWKARVQERPLSMLGIAFAGGLLFSFLTRGRGSRRSGLPFS